MYEVPTFFEIAIGLLTMVFYGIIILINVGLYINFNEAKEDNKYTFLFLGLGVLFTLLFLFLLPLVENVYNVIKDFYIMYIK